MSNCPKCGLPVSDGAKFCNACGAQLIINQRICKMCGNTLAEDAKFCNVCGTPCPVKKDETVVEDRNPTMDEIAVPIIDESVLKRDLQKSNEEMPTMDSVYLPGQEPVSEPVQRPHVVDLKKSAPMPTPEEIAMASRNVTVPQTPVVNENSYVSGISVGSRNANPTPGVLPTNGSGSFEQNSFGQNNMPYRTQNNTIPQGGSFGGNNGMGMPNQNNGRFSAGGVNLNKGVQQPSYITPEGARTYGNPAMGNQNIPNMPNMQNMGAMNNAAVPQKSNSRTVINIILIVLIIAVILVDVFWLFRDKIFGSSDDKKAKSNMSVVTMDNESDIFDDIIDLES